MDGPCSEMDATRLSVNKRSGMKQRTPVNKTVGLWAAPVDNWHQFTPRTRQTLYDVNKRTQTRADQIQCTQLGLVANVRTMGSNGSMAPRLTTTIGTRISQITKVVTKIVSKSIPILARIGTTNGVMLRVTKRGTLFARKSQLEVSDCWYFLKSISVIKIKQMDIL